MPRDVRPGRRWRNTIRHAVWWAPLAAASAVLVVVIGPPHSGRTVSAAQATPVNPAVVYTEHCASCHGATGLGTARGPSLQGVGEAAVDFYLSTGRMPKGDTNTNKQPPFTPVFPPAVIAALDRYVTSMVAHGGPGIPSVNAAAGNVAAGGVLYRENCSGCHEVLGTGGQLVDRPVPAITEATPKQLGEAVRVGPGPMPKFGQQPISDRQLNAIAAYVQTLRHPDDRGGNPLSHLGPVAEGAIAWLLGMVALIGFVRWIGKRA
ncbi:MAG: c-type cytochrome [Acidimicrobiaceae bacterium]|nr:c-type cytochrome [Acidimicrobiaceae bacterium]